MKIIYSLFLLGFFSFFSGQSWALEAQKSAQLFHHLQEVNKNWSNINPATYQEQIQFATDADRIQRHLQEVEKVLRLKETHHLGIENKRNRLKMLDVLHAYSSVGNFPINTFHSARQPYFIDMFGTHCAVGYLVKESGFPEISLAIAKTQNFAYVPEIQSKELIQWSIDFGFSLEELALIQPTYAPNQSYSQVGGGTNGVVSCSYSSSNGVLFGGNFTEFNNLPCLNIGQFSNGQLSCVGNGIDGKIVGVARITNNEIIVAGEFNQNGITYPMAKYDGNTWTYYPITGVPNARASSFNSIVNGSYIKIAVSAPSIIGGQEIWSLNSLQFLQWQKLAFVPGVVYDIDCSNPEVYAGHFDSIQIVNITPPQWYVGKNVIVKDNIGGWQSGMIGSVPDTIYSILTQGNTIYLGGYSGTNPGGVAFSRYLNGVSQPLLTNEDMLPGTSTTIYDISKFKNNEILIGGDIPSEQFIVGTFGRNLYAYNPALSSAYPISQLDSTVRTIVSNNGIYYIGGEFTYNGSDPNMTDPLNHLIYLESGLSLPEVVNPMQLNLYPNPSSGLLLISGVDPQMILSVQILDLQGKVVFESSETKLDASKIKAGIYLVNVQVSNGQTIQKRWVKE